jgi:transposase
MRRPPGHGLSDWIGSHTRTFAFIGGITAMVVSDNLRSGITKACFYEPAANRSYVEMVAHYDNRHRAGEAVKLRFKSRLVGSPPNYATDASSRCLS